MWSAIGASTIKTVDLNFTPPAPAVTELHLLTGVLPQDFKASMDLLVGMMMGDLILMTLAQELHTHLRTCKTGDLFESNRSEQYSTSVGSQERV